jgi:FHS family L-fucose permease-like MFS transporter
MNSKWNFTVVVMLFFLWALAHNLNPVLIPQLKQAFALSDFSATLVDSSFYLAYFIGALPAGMVIKRKGYKIGVLVGLCLFSLGAFVFFPAAYQLSYPLFLIGLFTIGFGITFLETAANPLVTQFNIGKSDSFRLNLAQSFNGLGATLAGWMGGYLVFNTTQGTTSSFELAQSVVAPYLIIGGVVLLVAILFSKINLSTEVSLSPISLLPIRRHYFRWAMLAQFFYVGVQVGLGGFFIRYMCAYYDWSKEDAAYLFSFALLLFMLGRFLGTVLLNWITATKLLGIVSVLATFSCFLMFVQWLGWFPLLMVFLWMSIMFPTIFSLGVSSLPEEEKPLGSSLLIMTIVGGAVMPPLMGKVSDALGLNWAMLIPMMGFMVIFVFSFRKKDHV